jgi:branched-chain amino acid aminotransferase
VLELARDMKIPAIERVVDMTELYVADEIFACGTSAFISPVKEVDGRVIGGGAMGPITSRIRQIHMDLMHGKESVYAHLLTPIA